MSLSYGRHLHCTLPSWQDSSLQACCVFNGCPVAPRQHCTIVRHVPALHTARSSLLGSTHQACGLHGQPGSLATTNTRRRIHEFSIVSIVCSSSSLPSDSAVLYGSDTHTVATTASIHTGNGQESVIGTPSSSSSTTSGVSHSHNSISSNSTSNCSSSSSPSSSSRNGSSILGGIVPLAGGGEELDQPPETGVLPDEAMKQLGTSRNRTEATVPSVSAIASSSSTGAVASAAGTICSPDPVTSPLYPPSERSQIQESWDTLMRWSKVFRKQKAAISPIEAADKIVVFGGGSFGTAMGCALARKKADLDVVLLLRDPYVCKDINTLHRNTKYLKEFHLPRNVRATTDAVEAITGASYAVHAVPVQHSRAFLSSIRDILDNHVPIVCVSKGLEVGTGAMMSEVIPQALHRRQPAVFVSGPSFAKEVMQGRPTGVVAASKDAKLARVVQELFASPCMRVNTTTDVTGVEICGALKNVLAIAAGIVEGLELGHNALAALVAQGCAEIRWLSEKLGANPATMSGLSGLGDIMLTCYGDLSRNRSVGVRLGRGESLEQILATSTQVAEGVATAGVVVSLARKYRVSLPVLTAVAQVLDNNLTPAQAVAEIMSLPQIEEH
eukprot:jgi/Chrzof1/2010/Cz10g29180.t1_GPD1[v5.2]